MKTLEGKRVIILGGSAGIGLATARSAAEEGAKVVIVSGNQNRINEALKTLPLDAAGYAVDLSKEENIVAFFNTIGEFDHLVYTAGENLNLKVLEQTDLSDARDFFTLRYWSALAAVKSAVPFIKSGGSVNLISGIASQRPGAGWWLGSSICGAMDGLTRALAVELAPIRVNAVSPGVVQTNLWDGMSEDQRALFYQQTADMMLVKRVGQAEDIAQAFTFLMKETFMTGQIITVDGGAVLV